MRVRFLKNYSDNTGSYRRGWECNVPDDIGKQLIDSETAAAVNVTNAPPADTTTVEQATPRPQTRPRAKRGSRQPKPADPAPSDAAGSNAEPPADA